MTYTAEEKRICAERELKVRAHVYPKMVQLGKLSAGKAAREIALMKEIEEDYRQQAIKERLV